jgi:hypothetical protein
MMRSFSLGLVAAAAAILAACSDNSGPNDRGRAEAFVRDDPNTAAAAPSPSAAASQLLFSGSLAGNTQVSASADGSTWVDLGSLNGITINLQRASDSSTVHGESDLEVGTYSRVRLTFRGVRARLEAGSIFGGLTLNTQVEVVLGGSDEEVVIEKTVPSFAVEAGTLTHIYFELNSEAWLTETSVQARSVADAAVQQSVSVRVVER